MSWKIILIFSLAIDARPLNLADNKISVSPSTGHMLGGTVIKINGYEFTAAQNVSCVFDAKLKVSAIIQNKIGICVQPRILVNGNVSLEILSEEFYWKGVYSINTPEAGAKIRLNFNKEDNYSIITITWNPDDLNTDKVDVQLLGYREKTSPEFLDNRLIRAVENTGEYVILPNDYKDQMFPTLMDLTSVVVQISPTNCTFRNICPIIWSDIIMSTPFIEPQLVRKYGQDWPKVLFHKLAKRDRNLGNFLHKLPSCPYWLTIARCDQEFIFDYRDSTEITCYKSRATPECRQQHCCYGKNLSLLLPASYPRRSSKDGCPPYSEKNKVPGFSNHENDEVPKYLSCTLQGEQSEDCKTYRQLRLTVIGKSNAPDVLNCIKQLIEEGYNDSSTQTIAESDVDSSTVYELSKTYNDNVEESFQSTEEYNDSSTQTMAESDVDSSTVYKLSNTNNDNEEESFQSTEEHNDSSAQTVEESAVDSSTVYELNNTYNDNEEESLQSTVDSTSPEAVTEDGNSKRTKCDLNNTYNEMESKQLKALILHYLIILGFIMIGIAHLAVMYVCWTETPETSSGNTRNVNSSTVPENVVFVEKRVNIDKEKNVSEESDESMMLNAQVSGPTLGRHGPRASHPDQRFIVHE